MRDRSKQEQLQSSQKLLGEIFAAFTEAKQRNDGKNAFDVLQMRIAEHAGELLAAGLTDLKSLVDTLLKLDGVNKEDGDQGAGNEAALQAFLRKSDSEGVTQ